MKDEKEFEFDDEPDSQLDDLDFGMKMPEVTVNMESTYIEMIHTLGGNILSLTYHGDIEDIIVMYSKECARFDMYTEFRRDFPQLDSRVLAAINYVFIELRYYGYDFYSGDFSAALQRWLANYVFDIRTYADVEKTKYVIEKETQALLVELSNTRLHKSSSEREDHKYTPLTWASPNEIERHYRRYKESGYYDKK